MVLSLRLRSLLSVSLRLPVCRRSEMGTRAEECTAAKARKTRLCPKSLAARPKVRRRAGPEPARRVRSGRASGPARGLRPPRCGPWRAPGRSSSQEAPRRATRRATGPESVLSAGCGELWPRRTPRVTARARQPARDRRAGFHGRAQASTVLWAGRCPRGEVAAGQAAPPPPPSGATSPSGTRRPPPRPAARTRRPAPPEARAPRPAVPPSPNFTPPPPAVYRCSARLRAARRRPPGTSGSLRH